MHVKLSVLLCATLMLGACSNDQAVEIASEKTLSAPLTASGEIVSLDTASVSPPSVRGMWQMKVQFLVPESSTSSTELVRPKNDSKRVT